MTGPRRDLHSYTLFETVGAEVRAPGPYADHDVGRRTHRVHAHLAVAEVDQRTDVATVVHFVHAHGVDDGVAEFIQGVGNVDHQDLATTKESLHVLAESKDSHTLGRLVGTDTFEGAHSVVQGVTEYMGRRVLPVDQGAVHPDLLRGRYGHLQPSE